MTQSFSEKLLGGKVHLLDQCHEVQKLRTKVQRKPDRRYTQSQTRDPIYKKPNEVDRDYVQKSMCLNFLTFKVTAAPPRRKEFVAKPKKKDKKKCPRKLTDSGMPKVEYT